MFFFPTRRLCLVSSSRTLVSFQRVFVFFSPHPPPLSGFKQSHSGEFSKSVCFFSPQPPPLSGFKQSHSGEFSKSVCLFFPTRRLCLVSSSRTLVSFQEVFVFFFPQPPPLTGFKQSHSGEFSKSVCFFPQPPPLSGFKQRSSFHPSSPLGKLAAFAHCWSLWCCSRH